MLDSGTFKNITAYGVELGEMMDTVMYTQGSTETVTNYEWRPLFTTKATPDYIWYEEWPFGLIQIPLWL